MPSTFGDAWRSVRQHVPDAPPLLVQSWVQSAYAVLSDQRPWSWTLQPGQLVWQDAIDFTPVADGGIGQVTVTMGSTTVTSAALFDSTMAGRQFRVGTYPIYTVASFTNASTVVLNLPYYGTEPVAGTTGPVDAQILDAYATMPATFGAFTALVDPINQRWVPWWVTTEEMDLLDPVRMAADSTPRLLAALALSDYTPTLGQVQYEYWPKPTAAGALQYFMRTRPESLADATPFKGVLGQRPDVLRTGALAQAARWPGTLDRKNPYFNLQLARDLDTKFEGMCNQLDNRDDDQYQLSIDKVPWDKWSSFAWAYNTRLLQMTDATLGSYFGYSGYPAWN